MAAGIYEVRAEIAREKNKLAMTIIASICSTMLEKMGITNYRIEKNSSGKLQLRQSTSIMVSSEQQQRDKSKVESILAILSSANILNYSKTRTTGCGLDYYTFSITSINASKLLAKIGMSDQVESAYSHSIEPALWSAIPAEIKKRWSRFSPDMQQHIIECISLNVESTLGSTFSTRIFTDSVRDPIMAAVPKIPVRFPANKDDQFMDLTDVLNIQYNRDAGKRLDPFNRQPFDLKDLVPASDKLQRIQEVRAMGLK